MKKTIDHLNQILKSSTALLEESENVISNELGNLSKEQKGRVEVLRNKFKNGSFEDFKKNETFDLQKLVDHIKGQ